MKFVLDFSKESPYHTLRQITSFADLFDKVEIQELIEDLIDSFFKKSKKKKKKQTKTNYHDRVEAGGINGEFYTHINYHTMKQSLIELIKNPKDSYIFLETGCAAHGTKSTLLWDKFVNLKV